MKEKKGRPRGRKDIHHDYCFPFAIGICVRRVKRIKLKRGVGKKGE